MLVALGYIKVPFPKHLYTVLQTRLMFIRKLLATNIICHLIIATLSL